MTDSTQQIIYQARNIAYEAHRHQVDHGGNPYIFHLIAVAEHCQSFSAQAAGYLHDILEDTETGVEDLVQAGMPLIVITAVELLTRTPDETYHEYIERLKPNPIAREVKLADLHDNLDFGRLNRDVQPQDVSLANRYRRAIKDLEL